MGFMQTESILQSKNRSGPAKNRFSVALNCLIIKLICVTFFIFWTWLHVHVSVFKGGDVNFSNLLFFLFQTSTWRNPCAAKSTGAEMTV